MLVDYMLISELGSGSYGVVYKALSNKDQKMYAIKKSKKPIWNMHHRAQYLSEITHARSLSPHPSIITIHDAWEEGGHIYTQMELCAMSLKEVLSNSMEPNISEKVVWQYISGTPPFFFLTSPVSSLLSLPFLSPPFSP